ncbi:MAG TPA: SDR family oxidoreductase [Aggregatilinea sp.]|uniref:SDR family oxidoreductase n=1 Tax=Aggregatilinea sp. TaxID=2806333 RepID=UPI002CBE6F30|nr:SDR family oxidoreductase [Aggregatilinea sp.]HML22058.1 SDR family oxidoreductase [Aggregatilinea sp.]
MGKLDDQVALVTGGGTGIGQGIALALAREGAQVVICGRRLGPLQNTVAQIESEGGQALAIQATVADEMDVERLIEETTEAFGPVDILVNNAGIGGGGAIHKHSIQDWDQIMGINLRGPFLMARAVLPSMRERRRGHIINISSESGLEYYPGSGAYGVSKHALNALSEYIQRENQDLNIHVHVICPGMVISEMSEDAVGLNKNKCLLPEDIADLVLWLVTRRDNVKIGRPVLIQTMENPWE